MNLLDILLLYASRLKLLDIEAINKICDIILKENKLNNIINFKIINNRDSKFINTNGVKLGEYDMDHTIYIFYNDILNCIKNDTLTNGYYDRYDLNDFEDTMVNNINILETIFHEIEHAKQVLKVKDISDSSIERVIYQYEYDFMYPDDSFNDSSLVRHYINSFKKYIIYNLNYNISFMERMANINSKEVLINILRELGSDFKNIYDIQKKLLDIFMFKEFKYNISGPTNTFLYKINCMEDFVKSGYSLIVNEMNFEERYRYGFGISNTEYKKIRYK